MDYDLFVVGAGSGGVRAARMSAQLGARVAVAESGALGGTCVNVGCVPKKLFVYAAQFARSFPDAAGFGLDVPAVPFQWERLRDNKDQEITRLNGIYGNLLENAGATLLRGRAEIVSPHEVRVNEEVYSAERILIATGGQPKVPSVPGQEHMITSDEVFHLASWPKRALVIGGGYIAVEFAGIFQGTGVDTTLIHRGPRLLRGFDQDVQTFAAAQYETSGLTVRLNTEVSSITQNADQSYTVILSDGNNVTVDLILAATGRVANIFGLGADNVGIAIKDDGAIQVNAQYQTSVDSIYAIGDVVGHAALTPIALAEGTYLAHEWFGQGGRPVRYDVIPTAVFSDPPIGTVGMTEAEARENHDIDVYESNFKPMQNTLSGNPGRAYMKLLVDRQSQRVLGLHMVGPDAGEITQGFAVALAMGATKADFDQTVGIHPTSAEEFVTMRTPR